MQELFAALRMARGAVKLVIMLIPVALLYLTVTAPAPAPDGDHSGEE
jgi:hypothetical protein